MKSTCWDTGATDAIIKSGQKDTGASITICMFLLALLFGFLQINSNIKRDLEFLPRHVTKFSCNFCKQSLV